jgi:hypothetical protein
MKIDKPTDIQLRQLAVQFAMEIHRTNPNGPTSIDVILDAAVNIFNYIKSNKINRK